MPLRRGRPSVAAAVVATLLSVTLAGCGSIIPTAERQPLTIGTHASLGNTVIAEVYGQYLDEHGYAVRYNPGIGDRDAYLAGLRDGVVDLVPDFTADLLLALSSDSDARQLDEVDAALSVALSQLELRVLEPAPAERPDSLVVTRAFADEHDLASIADLSELATPLTIAADARWERRASGREGLGDTYGLLGWTSLPLPSPTPDSLAELLVAGSAQVAVMPVNATAFAESDLVVLDDPLALFPAQHLVPVVSADSRSVRLSDLVNTVSAELTTSAVDTLIARAADGSSTPEAIAERWLRSAGLLSEPKR